MSIVTKLFQKRRQDRVEKATSWQQFVKQCADESIEVETADAMLTSFGKTESDLAKAIEVHRKAVAAKAILAEEPGLKAEQSANFNERSRLIAEMNEQIETIQRNFGGEISSLKARSNEIVTLLNRVGDAQSFLIQLPKPEDVAEQLNAIRVQQKAIMADQTRIMEDKAAGNSSGLQKKDRRLQLDLQHAANEAQLKRLAAEYAELEWNALA